MLQTSSWLLTSVSRNLASDHSHLWRSWVLVMSWIRPEWPPTCLSSMSSSVEHLYLHQVLLFDSTLLYTVPLYRTVFCSAPLCFTGFASTRLDSVWLYSALLFSTLLCSTQLYWTWLYFISCRHWGLLLIYCVCPLCFWMYCMTNICTNNKKVKIPLKGKVLNVFWFQVKTFY